MVYINHIIKGHRAALKKYKTKPLEFVIAVNKEGYVKCYKIDDWAKAIPLYGRRVDILAIRCYKVRAAQLSETMVKRTAIKILNGEL